MVVVFAGPERHAPNFSRHWYVNLVAAGEASGALPQISAAGSEHLTQAKELRDRVQQALIYPAFLALAGAILVTIFITFMVPQLSGFMAQTGGALPCRHGFYCRFTTAITGYWWVGGTDTDWAESLVSVLWFALRKAASDGPVSVNDPGYGRVIRHRYYAQFSRTLGTLMENGVPLLRSLDLVSEIAGNRFLEIKLGEVRKAVIDGATLSAALQQQNLFPDLFTDMMAVGEQTGHFAELCKRSRTSIERELDRSVGVISQLIPPVIIVMIALLVGLVVSASCRRFSK